MIDGANYVALPLFKWQQTGLVPLLDNGHVDKDNFFLNQAPHYSTSYRCSDGGYISVQSLEPQFYAELLKVLFPEEDGGIPSDLPNQYDNSSWPWMRERFAAIFASRTRDEWARKFRGLDACAVPILSAKEAARHPHNVKRGNFSPSPGIEGAFEPNPAPKLCRTPGLAPALPPCPEAILLPCSLSVALPSMRSEPRSRTRSP